MIPTLAGDHRLASCRHCRLKWMVDPTVTPANTKESLICFHCGRHDGLRSFSHVYPGSVVKVIPVNPTTLAIGDLVAVRWGQTVHVKRIAGLPGDVVDVRDQTLCINGSPLAIHVADRGDQALPMFLVDDDARRSESHWAPASNDSRWRRVARGQWKFQADLNNGDQVQRDSSSTKKTIADDVHDWLVYHHRSVHDQNLPSPIWDDYPFNITLQRRLVRAQIVEIEGLAQVVESETNSPVLLSDSEKRSPAYFEIAFGVRVPSCESSRADVNGAVPVEVVSRNQWERFVVRNRQVRGITDAPVSPENPIAIRSHGGTVWLKELIVRRAIHYRIGDHDDPEAYPMTIPRAHCFVVGDNVPVSVDSRTWGAIPLENVIGVVQQ